MKEKFDGLVLNFKNLHIHLDERTEIHSEYTYPKPEGDELKHHCDGCVFDDDDFDEDDDSEEEDEDCDDSFVADDVIKAVTGKTGFSEETVKKILETQAEVLIKHLMDGICETEPAARKKAGAL